MLLSREKSLHRMAKSSFCRDTVTKRAGYEPYEHLGGKINSADGGFRLREERAYAESSEFRSSRPENCDDLNTIGRRSYVGARACARMNMDRSFRGLFQKWDCKILSGQRAIPKKGLPRSLEKRIHYQTIEDD